MSDEKSQIKMAETRKSSPLPGGASSAVKNDVTDGVAVKLVLDGEIADDVVLRGSWDEWSRDWDLKRNKNKLENSVCLDLPRGYYEYKYRGGRRWFCDKSKPMVSNVFGTLNNYMEVKKVPESSSALVQGLRSRITHINVQIQKKVDLEVIRSKREEKQEETSVIDAEKNVRDTDVTESPIQAKGFEMVFVDKDGKLEEKALIEAETEDKLIMEDVASNMEILQAEKDEDNLVPITIEKLNEEDDLAITTKVEAKNDVPDIVNTSEAETTTEETLATKETNMRPGPDLEKNVEQKVSTQQSTPEETVPVLVKNVNEATSSEATTSNTDGSDSWDIIDALEENGRLAKTIGDIVQTFDDNTTTKSVQPDETVIEASTAIHERLEGEVAIVTLSDVLTAEKTDPDEPFYEVVLNMMDISEESQIEEIPADEAPALHTTGQTQDITTTGTPIPDDTTEKAPGAAEKAAENRGPDEPSSEVTTDTTQASKETVDMATATKIKLSGKDLPESVAENLVNKTPTGATATAETDDTDITVVVQGSWDGWRQAYMLDKSAEGVHSVTLMLPSGLHEYKFRVGNNWFHNEAKPVVPNVFGTLNNYLEVRKVTDDGLTNQAQETNKVARVNVKIQKKVDLEAIQAAEYKTHTETIKQDEQSQFNVNIQKKVELETLGVSEYEAYREQETLSKTAVQGTEQESKDSDSTAAPIQTENGRYIDRKAEGKALIEAAKQNIIDMEGVLGEMEVLHAEMVQYKTVLETVEESQNEGDLDTTPQVESAGQIIQAFRKNLEDETFPGEVPQSDGGQKSVLNNIEKPEQKAYTETPESDKIIVKPVSDTVNTAEGMGFSIVTQLDEKDDTNTQGVKKESEKNVPAEMMPTTEITDSESNGGSFVSDNEAAAQTISHESVKEAVQDAVAPDTDTTNETAKRIKETITKVPIETVIFEEEIEKTDLHIEEKLSETPPPELTVSKNFLAETLPPEIVQWVVVDIVDKPEHKVPVETPKATGEGTMTCQNAGEKLQEIAVTAAPVTTAETDAAVPDIIDQTHDQTGTKTPPADDAVVTDVMEKVKDTTITEIPALDNDAAAAETAQPAEATVLEKTEDKTSTETTASNETVSVYLGDAQIAEEIAVTKTSSPVLTTDMNLSEVAEKPIDETAIESAPPAEAAVLDCIDVRLVWKGEASGDVVLQGSWDGWGQAYKLNKSEEGEYSISLKLPFGQHEYKFRVGKTWVEDETKPTVPNVFGTQNNILTVPDIPEMDSKTEETKRTDETIMKPTACIEESKYSDSTSCPSPNETTNELEAVTDSFEQLTDTDAPSIEEMVKKTSHIAETTDDSDPGQTVKISETVQQTFPDVTEKVEGEVVTSTNVETTNIALNTIDEATDKLTTSGTLTNEAVVDAVLDIVQTSEDHNKMEIDLPAPNETVETSPTEQVQKTADTAATETSPPEKTDLHRSETSDDKGVIVKPPDEMRENITSEDFTYSARPPSESDDTVEITPIDTVVTGTTETQTPISEITIEGSENKAAIGQPPDEMLENIKPDDFIFNAKPPYESDEMAEIASTDTTNTKTSPLEIPVEESDNKAAIGKQVKITLRDYTHIKLLWNGEAGGDVFLQGSWDGWRQSHKLKRGDYSLTLKLPVGLHEYKFRIGNSWFHDKTKTTVHNCWNTLNNVINVA